MTEVLIIVMAALLGGVVVWFQTRQFFHRRLSDLERRHRRECLSHKRERNTWKRERTAMDKRLRRVERERRTLEKSLANGHTGDVRRRRAQG